MIDILCSGPVLEPEVEAPRLTKEQLRDGVPEDGELITDKNYQALLLEFAGR